MRNEKGRNFQKPLAARCCRFILGIYLCVQRKKELIKIGVSYSDLDDGIAISWDIVEYLLNKWEIKYYQNRNLTKNNLKGAKKNSFFGYFFTYFKSIYHQKVNFSKDYNGNTIKRSKGEELKVKEQCKKIDRKVTISRKNKEIMKANLIAKGQISFDYDVEVADKGNKFELNNYLIEKYTSSEREVILYKAELGEKSLLDLAKKVGISKDKIKDYIEMVMYKAERDRVLYELLLESLS